VGTLLRILGIDDTSGPWYSFWSGIGADLGELAIVGAILRHVNCQRKGCWRLGHHHQGSLACRTHREEH
jgi:hypothetical protein